MKLKNKADCHHVLGHWDHSLAPGEVKEVSDELASHPHVKKLLAEGKLEVVEEKAEKKSKAKADKE